jgi:hypothetical protein
LASRPSLVPKRRGEVRQRLLHAQRLCDC